MTYKRIGLILVSSLLLTGCWDRKELNEIALVRGIGIDMLENGQIEISVEISVPKTPSGAGSETEGTALGSGGTTLPIVRTGRGVTIPDALEKLQKVVPRKIFWGHTEVIIINEKLAKSGLRDKMDYFVRNPRFRLHAYVFITKGKAKDMLGLETSLYSPSEVLSDFSEETVMLHVTLINLLDMLNSGDVSIPMIKKVPPQKKSKPEQTIPFILESAIFKDDKMVGTINDKLTRGVKWIQNDIEESQVTVHTKNGNGYISMTLLRAETTLEPVIKDNKWKMIIKAHTEDDIIMNESQMNLKDPKNIIIIEKELEGKLKARLQNTLDKVQKEYRADIFGFGEAFHRKYPKQWNESKNHWDDIYPNLEVEYDIHANVLRTGAGSAH